MNIINDAWDINHESAEEEASSSAVSLIKHRYQQIRNQTVFLCTPLETEDFVVQPHPEVSPPKWHLAHTTWFFEEAILKQFVSDYQAFNPHYSHLFNSYYKSVGAHWLQDERGQLSRPTVAEVFAYRHYVDEKMVVLLREAGSEIQAIVELGLQHEQQHQELLLMDIKRILGTNPSMPAYSEAQWSSYPVVESWTKFTEGIYEVGHAGHGFAYDNECPRHKQYCYEFSIRDNSVTCEEYIAFIDAGGYSNPTFWLSQGWHWLQDNTISAPFYWFKKDGCWHQYTLHGVKPITAHEPVVHVSYYEADAFARWKKCRLPSEAELELWLDDQPGFMPSRMELFHPYRSDQPCNQVWYWTSSHYSPYPGYQPYSGMLGEYNGKFMCNQFVLRGGCVATPEGHYRASYRNFYKPEQRWLFSGIKLAK